MATTYGKDYVDFDLDFDKHPAHGDLSQVKKSTAISRSLKKYTLFLGTYISYPHYVWIPLNK